MRVTLRVESSDHRTGSKFKLIERKRVERIGLSDIASSNISITNLSELVHVSDAPMLGKGGPGGNLMVVRDHDLIRHAGVADYGGNGRVDDGRIHDQVDAGRPA